MPQQVAEINGKKVYSDKTVSSIVNTRITFEDGSWCDVTSGQIANKGPGYINIGSPEGSSEKVTVGPKDFGARNLEIRDVVADVDVQTHGHDIVAVKIIGPDSEVKSINVNQQGDTVVIEGAGGKSGSGVTIISGHGNTVTRIGRIRGSGIAIGDGAISIRGNVVVGSGGEENETKITVTIPKGGSINLSGVSGKSTIGDTDGPLQVSTQDGEIKAGRVGSATLSVQGSGDIDVREVASMLTMNVMGSGDASVRGGKVHTLAINVMGSGDAKFNGEAENANLQVMGSGDISVRFVKNRPNKNIMGSGDIDVGNW